MNRAVKVVACAVCALVVGTAAVHGQSARANGKLSADTRAKLMASLGKAEAYLQGKLQADGTWDRNPGVNALVLTSLFREPGKDKAATTKQFAKSLDALVALAKPDGGIYDSAIPHYVTALSTSALVAAGRPQDKPVIEKARRYLVENMLDEGEGVAKTDFWYGGMGYGKTTRADGRRNCFTAARAHHGFSLRIWSNGSIIARC